MSGWRDWLATWLARWYRWRYGLGEVGLGCRIERGARFAGNRRAIRLGRGVRIAAGALVVCSGSKASIDLGDSATLHAYAILDTGPDGSIRCGRSLSVNPFSVLYGHGGLVMGDYVRIAAQTVVIPANHVFSSLDRPIARQGLVKQGICIGSDVWIGAGCKILDGVTIGDGCVVAAGSVVTRSVAAYMVVGGVPAQVLKSRLAEQQPGVAAEA